jgi:hypothetical protein
MGTERVNNYLNNIAGILGETEEIHKKFQLVHRVENLVQGRPNT